MVTQENMILELVINGGDARGKALGAIQAASKQDFELAERRMEECVAALQKAHDRQTEMLQKEAEGLEEMSVSLLMVHAQDHLMNAMTVRDLAKQMVEMYRVLYNK